MSVCGRRFGRWGVEDKNPAGNGLRRAAPSYLRKGYSPVPIGSGKKSPTLTGWPKLRMREDEIADHFGRHDNIGLILGEPSGGLVDVDLDVGEAIKLAEYFLPSTHMRHGRQRKPTSHYWYLAKSTPEPAKFSDADGVCLVELRSDGQQTLVPPSVHPSGDAVVWEAYGEPATVDAEELRRCVVSVAACALVARSWPSTGSRHQAAMALAGMLLRNGWTEARAADFITYAAWCAGDEEWRERGNDVAATARRIEVGGRATGIPTLAGLLGAEVIERLADWLQLKDLQVDQSFVHIAPWPDPLQSDAFYGLAGDVVRIIEPHSEEDPAALLVQLRLMRDKAKVKGVKSYALPRKEMAVTYQP
jgi:bifunctional DNA primase/polymerase-like protein